MDHILDILYTMLYMAASQRFCNLRKSGQVFHDRLLLGRCFRGFVLPVLQHWSAVLGSAADTYLELPCMDGSCSQWCPFLTRHSTSSICGSNMHVCCTRSGVSQCTLFMVVYMCCMNVPVLFHIVLWLHIERASILAAKPLSTAVTA